MEPTLHALGVQVLIADDDNRDARIDVRYREATCPTWTSGLPLFRVLPETVPARPITEQFAGSLFDLVPGTTYEIELHVTDAGSFRAALAAARPGDVISLRDGLYTGTFFSLLASGTQVVGRLAWPLIYTDDGGAHADDQGIRVAGDGHERVTNPLQGFDTRCVIGVIGVDQRNERARVNEDHRRASPFGRGSDGTAARF